MLKRILKLTLFNLSLLVIAVLAISKNWLGLGFDTSVGAFKFALTIVLSFLYVATFCYVNYRFLTDQEKVNYKIDKMSGPDDCIRALEKCRKTNPDFNDEIEKAIKQLYSLKRRQQSLKALFENSKQLEPFSYVQETGELANNSVVENIRRIINRLIVFDNDEYKLNPTRYPISPHKKFINEIIEKNYQILREYEDLLLAVSSIGDSEDADNTNSIRRITDSLNSVLSGAVALDEKIFEQLEVH